ncbi:hypothetical protein [Nocardioides ferulae]|uniref:hypothetical protein n=1 Tax=Nocardioides ferulae TaxID=2340821 RepID=UPI000F864ADD|nr:hypothetical protein [Nocardioides ferulae]
MASSLLVLAVTGCGEQDRSDPADRQARAQEAVDHSERPDPALPASVSADAGARVWSQIAFGQGALWNETFNALTPMVRSADVTVLGTVTEAGPGRELVSEEDGEKLVDVEVFMQVKADEVLAGNIADGTGHVTVVFGPYDEATMAATPWADYVGEQAVFVLRRSGTAVRGPGGVQPANPDLLALNVYTVVYAPGILDADSRGHTRAPWWAEDGGWPQALEGRPFGDLIADIRSAGKRA